MGSDMEILQFPTWLLEIKMNGPSCTLLSVKRTSQDAQIEAETKYNDTFVLSTNRIETTLEFWLGDQDFLGSSKLPYHLTHCSKLSHEYESMEKTILPLPTDNTGHCILLAVHAVDMKA